MKARRTVDAISVEQRHSGHAKPGTHARHFLRQGGYTPPMDLKGWQRPIDRVDMVYKTVPNFKGLATVCVEGLQN